MAVYECPDCRYRYDEEKGDENEGYPPATLFDNLPEGFVCPACGVCYKDDFVKLQPE